MAAETTPRPSTVKLLDYLAQVQALSDAELAEAVPVASPTLARAALAAVTTQIPEDPADLDDFLVRVAQFVLALVSDGPTTYTVAELEPGEEVLDDQALEEARDEH